MERGACTFAQKVLRAQAAGAAAVIIVQTMDVWPYTMTDSKGESRAMTIPAFMLSTKQGKGCGPLVLLLGFRKLNNAIARLTLNVWACRFVGYLRDKSGDEATVADIAVRRDARECVICQVDMSIGMKVTRMPCQVRMVELSMSFANSGEHFFYSNSRPL